MWQRIQTVFLVIIVLAMILTVFLPIWVGQSENVTHELYPLHYTTINGAERISKYFPYSIMAILSIASATIAAVEIGKYKNRVLQMKLGALNALLMAGVVGCAVYFANQMIQAHHGNWQYGFGLYAPIIAVISNFLANRFIRRDEKLVRDSDRLR
jgi:glucan phosphoethanolaminetransferase (alkaline phosphatase superfamily)